MSTSFPQALSTEAGRLMIPLKQLNTPNAMVQFLRDLGYSFTGVLGSLNLAGLVTDVEELIVRIKDLAEAQTDQDKASAALDLLDQIIQVATTLQTEIPNIQTALNNVSNLQAEGLGNFVQTFLRRVVDNLVFTYLQDFRSPIFGFLYIAGIADRPTDTQSSLPYKKLNWDKFGTLFSDPAALFNQTYQWNTNFDHQKFLERFAYLLTALSIPGGIYTQSPNLATSLGRGGDPDPKEVRVPLLQAGVWGTNWTEIDLNVSPIPQAGPKLPGLLLYPYFFGGASVTVDLSEDWELVLSGAADLGGGVGLEIRPGEPLNIQSNLFGSPLNATGLDLKLQIKRVSEGEGVLFGSLDKSYLSSTKFELTTFAKKSGASSDMGAELQMGTMKLVITMGDGDGFLKKVMPNGFHMEFDFGIGWSLEKGVYFVGGSSFTVYFDMHITLGPLEIQGLSATFRPLQDGLQLELGSDIKLELGPFMAKVENVGIRTGLTFPQNGGRFGPVDFDIGFKPPTGIGLRLDTGVVRGGGYISFDYANESYAGVLELTIKDTISIKAIGLLTTRFPDGSSGFSLLLLITAEFTPIQLGFGFTLNGVGGLVGVHRTMVLQALRDGVKNGSIDHIMFPADPVGNATQIISDLRTIFPPQEGRFTFGPMGIIGWGTPTLITLEVGLLIEVPSPVRIALVGVLKALLPDENNALLKLQVAFVGTIDFEQKFITFDASIFDSRLLTFTLEGDMAVRIKWGNNPNFVFTIGGFHPQYTPPPLALPALNRLTINLLGGDNPRLTVQTYFAVTSNTVQFGSRVDFYYKVTGKIYVEGWLGFDALIQFSPFYFNISFSAGLAVYYKNKSVLSISLSVMLEGPTPWHAKGRAEFKILCFKCKVDFDKTWGQNANTTLPDKAVLPELEVAVANKGNWLATPSGNGDTQVSLRQVDTSNLTRILAQPGTVLSVSQKVVPLDTVISKFGNHRPSDYNHFHIELLDASLNSYTREEVKEEFAPNSFFSLNKAEQLSRPSFERHNSGLKGRTLNDGLTSDLYQERDVVYEQILLDNRFGPPTVMPHYTERAAPFQHWTQGGSAGKSPLGMRQRGHSPLRPAMVSVNATTYSVVDLDNLTIYQSRTADSFEEARQLMQAALATRPELEGQLQVIPTHEIH